jgi:hypothetical protein
MIETLLRRLDPVPVKTKLILRVRIRHLVETIISPELPAFPHILYRGHPFLLHALGDLRNLGPHSKDVLSSYQCKLLLSRATVKDGFQQVREGRAVLKAGDDRCDTCIMILGMIQNGNINVTYHQSLIQDQRAPSRYDLQCRKYGPEAYPRWLQTSWL